MQKLETMFRINPLYEADGYKPAHVNMLAPGTNKEYWTWIPRNLKYMPRSINKIMSTGQQFTWRYIHSAFSECFFYSKEKKGLDKYFWQILKKKALKFAEDLTSYFGMEYNGEHFAALWDLGYLPVKIKALPEGMFTPPNIPHMTGINTVDGYAWLGLFLETLVSKLSWQMPIAATLGFEFKKNAVEWVNKTDPENLWLADYMCHDFHSRGGNPFTSIAVGLGHALSNSGSDTLNVIPASRYYYDVADDKVLINSVLASEHSVTCTGIFYYEARLKAGKLDQEIKDYYAFDAPSEGSVEQPDYLAIAELLNLRDWLLKFPKGILSVVSDTMDLWKLITHILPRLKSLIMARDGKLVIRPDSGDPVDITCGKDDGVHRFTSEEDLYEFIRYSEDNEGDILEWESKFYRIVDVKDFIREYGEDQWNQSTNKNRPFEDFVQGGRVGILTPCNPPKLHENERKGVIELLADIFGTVETSTGYKRLDSHIGAIYGDSITLERQVEIYSRLAEKGFAATNIVLGIGSYTYVYMTRDTAGFAAKGAWFQVQEVKEPTGYGTYPGLETTSYNIYKDPVTDDGTKKSLKGMCAVFEDGDSLYVKQECTEEEEAQGLLQVIYEDGKFFNQQTFEQIRAKINK